MKKVTKIAIGTSIALAGAGAAYLYGTKKGKATRKKITSVANKKVAQIKKVVVKGKKVVVKGKKIIAQAKAVGSEAKKAIKMMTPIKKGASKKTTTKKRKA